MKDSWRIMPLSEVCDVRDGTHDSPKYIDSGIPFITSKNLSINGLILEDVSFISEFDHKRFSQRSFVENGDILFGMIGTVGKPIIVNENFEFSIKNVALLKFSKAKELLNTFAIQVLKSSIIDEQFKRKSDGGVQSFVSLSTIRSIDFPIPPLPQQQKIAKILSTCDEVIEKTEAAIVKYQALKQGLMHDLFTRGIDIKTGKLRPTVEDAPELYKQSKLGWIPKDWEVDELTNLTKLVTDGSHFSPVPQEKGMPIGNVKDMLDSTFNYANCTKILPEVFELLVRQNCSPKFGDVLLSKDGTIGRVIHFIDDKRIVLLSSIAIIRVNELIESEYLSWTLQSEFFDKALYSLLSGSALKRITLKDIQKIKIPFSKSLKEQKVISMRIESIQQKLQTELSALTKYQQLKAGLMQDLLTGKVEVGVE